MKKKNINILSFDVEDGYQGFIKRGIDGWQNFESTEEKNLDLILDLLSNKNITATFFVLGNFAEKNPNLVKMIHENGHEIASHGYSHKVLPELNPNEFREEIRKSKKILSNIIGEDIIGFRAPKWSVNKDSFWVFEILNEEGYKYDSSIFPSDFHEFGSSKYDLFPFEIKGADYKIIEFPAQVLPFGKLRIPAAGGFYFRALPYFISEYSLKKTNNVYNYGMVYLHPFEFDVDAPRVEAGFLFKMVRYYHLNKTLKYLTKLTENFSFSDIKSILYSENSNYFHSQ